MASLTSNLNIGTTNASSLVKSASSLASQLAEYQDQIHALDYANSAYTDDAFAIYQNYLTGRINTLNSTGTLANASKALTLTKTLESAMHSNISASITRENIDILTGNATNQDKYALIVRQYQRALNNGDLTLAQTLEKQAYDLNQTIQYQAQQSADAAAALARAGNGRTTGTSGVSYQGEVVTNLTNGLKYLNGLAKGASEKQLNKTLQTYAQQAKPQLQALGVNIKTDQPNYFDVVYGVAGAIYNAKVLQAQAENASNPLVAQTYASEAANYLSGATKFDTLAGKLTVQEIQQAQQDPLMFTYDNSTNTYKRDIQSGYQYMTFTNADGTTSQQLVPKYSAFPDTSSGRQAFNKIDFITPQETSMMTKLGLNFGENKSGTTGDGVQATITNNSPEWLKQVAGESGVVNFFTGPDGFVQFKAGTSTGEGSSYYTLMTDTKGLGGLFEHLPDGSIRLAGGDYGFNASAMQLLINKGQQTQYQVKLAEAQAQAKLQLAQQQAHQQLVAQQAARAVAPPAPRPSPVAQRLQPTASPQFPTYNPQGNNVNPQGNTFNPQGGTVNPQNGGTNAGTLHYTSGAGIRL